MIVRKGERPDVVQLAIAAMTRDELEALVSDVVHILWWVPYEERWDTEKEWDCAELLSVISSDVPTNVRIAAEVATRMREANG